MNKVILIGNLGADPEMRHTASGTPVCNLRLATNRKYKDKEGNTVEHTDWHRITLWGRQAEVAAQYLTKGRQVAIEGRIEYSTTGEGDAIKYFTDIVAERLELLGGKSGNNASSGASDPVGEPEPETPF